MFFNIIANFEEFHLPENHFRSLLGLSSAITTSLAVTKIAEYLRLALPAIFQFRIENMIVNILRVLDQSKVSRGYLKNAKLLLDVLMLPDRQQKLDVLNVLQCIRNSLHSNGIHNNDDMCITIEDCNFSFRRGEFVECASWAHDIVAMNAIVKVIREILRSPKVKAIPEPISSVTIEQQ